MWIAAVDFRKAFDSVHHSAIWHALAQQGVLDQYIKLIVNLYTDQSGLIAIDVESKLFSITRGTKQGDPLSSLIFNSVLEFAMKPAKETWLSNGFGFDIGKTEQGER